MKDRALAYAIAMSLMPVMSSAQGLYDRPFRYITMFGGHSARVLASQDIRTDYGFGIAWQKPEPHFKWRHGPSQLVVEAYYQHSNGQQRPTRGKITEALGVLWYARFRFPTRGFNLYGDIGEGVQLSTSESFDLGTRLNSTPMIGAGFAIRQGSAETLVGFRIMHLSNAGFNARNRGQNQVLFYVAVKF